uniref:DNA-directed RNA polymerase subunit beta' n=1 Tax=Spermatozopsis similis TaxID=3192 RepID=A0A4P1LU99_SPESI|nr:RNA polymerase beta' subunit [Spermatozopsis similis]AYQ95156.1 RNA polymerase beta' subunit [Spermatozopsis similis]
MKFLIMTFDKNIKNEKDNFFEKTGESETVTNKGITTSAIESQVAKKSTSYSKLSELRLLTIGLASPNKIRQWAEKTLPNGKIFGQVTSPNTLHHKTFKPQRGGLFCERIFGPLRDFECACEKSSRPTEEERKRFLESRKFQRRFCPNCDVEYTWSVIRRYQLGYIALIAPVTHIWYLKATPSYLSILLDFKKRHLESVVYCSQTLTLQYSSTAFYTFTMANSPHTLISSWKKVLTNAQTKPTQINFVNERELRVLKRKAEISTTLPQRLKNWRGLPSEPRKMTKLPPINGTTFHSTNKNILIPNFFKLDTMDFTSFRQINSSLSNSTIASYIYCRMQKLSQQRAVFLSLNKLMTEFFHRTYKETAKESKKLVWELSKRSASLSFKSNIKTKNKIFLEFANRPTTLKNKPVAVEVMSNANAKSKAIELYSLAKAKRVAVGVTRSVNTKSFSFSVPRNRNSKNFDLNSTIFWQLSIYRLRKDIMFELTVNPEDMTEQEKTLSLIQTYLLNSLLSFFKDEKIILNEFNSSFNKNLSTTQNAYIKAQSLIGFILKKKKRIFELFKTQLGSLIFIQQFQRFFELLNLSHESFNHSETHDFQTMSKTSADSTARNVLGFTPLLKPMSSKFYLKKNAHFLPQLIIARGDIQTNLNVFESSPPTPLRTKALLDAWKIYLESFPNVGIGKNLTESRRLPTETETQKNYLNKKHTKLFNNMYALSHRYRWELEKDWSSFLYYNYAAVEYSDSPIGVYQERIETNNTNYFAGAGVIQKLLQELDFDELRKIDKQNRILLYDFHKKLAELKSLSKRGSLTRDDKKEFKELLKKRDQLMRRTKLIRKLFRKNSRPEWMTLSVLPVLPPELRPIIKVQDQIAASDLNRLYQRVLYRNERLRKFLKEPATSYSPEMNYAQALLQEAVDNLIENGKGGTKPERDSRGRNLKSLSEILKGKQGRFRQHLLGKRVDYSGRSVIVVSPSLKIHECGLPKEMALELFLPFLIQRILHLNLSKTVIGAKNFISTQKELTFEILKELLQGHPILLNRAPTLHRLGIQAFQPKLIEGRAILLHPLVCSAFNADFDGDQMAVHVPITVEARAEAWKLMFARNHLLSPATGEPMLLPSQDMVLGCYYLTSENFKPLNLFVSPVFSNFMQVFQTYNQGKIPLQMPVWVKWDKTFETGLEKDEPIEVRIDRFGYRFEIFSKYQRRFNQKGQLISQFIRTTPGRILLHLLMEDSKN